MTADQGEVIDFLSRAASYGLAETLVERIDTHCSIVFLAGHRAYKLKRAIAFATLDYTSLRQREMACRAELALNRRTAPDLYLSVQAIHRGGNGNLTFDGAGPVVDWVVVMRRFDQSDLFDRLADDRRLDVGMMRELADELAAFHTAAEITQQCGGPAAIRRVIARWRQEWSPAAGSIDETRGAAYETAVSATLSATASLLDDRREHGKVRRCHGDLRLANICLLETRVTIFDCIEFDDEISCIDVLHDLAFPLMELHYRGLAECSNALFNRYIDRTGDLAGARALPLFLSLHAATRAKMLAAAAFRHPPSETPHLLAFARAHLAFAQSLLSARPPRVIAIGGLGGSGKRAVAQALAAEISSTPGARLIGSGTVRRQLMNMDLDARLPPAAYDNQVTDKVYQTLREQTASAIAAGMSVVANATFLDPQHRLSMTKLARELNVPFLGFWLESGGKGIKPVPRRDVSGPGDRDVSYGELAADPGTTRWHVVDTARGVPTSLAAVRLLVDALRN